MYVERMNDCEPYRPEQRGTQQEFRGRQKPCESDFVNEWLGCDGI